MQVKLRKGQSILEYTLLLGAVVGVIVAALLGSGGIKDKIKGTYDKAGTTIGNVTNNMDQGVFGM